MLPQINNHNEFEDIARLNSKIGAYNGLLNAEPIKKEQCMQLLNEINSMHMDIKKKMIDNSHMSPSYEGIRDFPGIGGQLELLNEPAISGIAADQFLSQELASNDGLLSVQDWESEIGVGSWFTWPTEEETAIVPELEQLNQMKSTLPVEPTNTEAANYFYSLKAFKNKLMGKLCNELDNKKDIKNFNWLLNSVNSEIETVKNFLPDVQAKDAAIATVAKTNLAQELSELGSQNMNDLTMMLANRNAINPGPPTKENIAAIIPSINDYDIVKLGGGNNVNWKITNPASGVELVIQVGEPAENQMTIGQLEQSSLNTSLSSSFYSSSPSGDCPYNLVLTELCVGGDLRSQRENDLADAPENDILRSATMKFKQLTNISKVLLEQNVIHPDIKLTNFLSDGAGNIIIADKKALTNIDSDGNVAVRGLVTTVLYSPPEYQQRNGPPNMDAESFMTYQLGLALYDYLVVPDISQDPAVTAWCEENPLNFDAPIFQSVNGAALKNLITQMVDPNPDHRPSVAEVETILTDLGSTLTAVAQVEAIQEAEVVQDIVVSEVSEVSEVAKPEAVKINASQHGEPQINFSDAIQDEITRASSVEELDDLKQRIESSADFKLEVTIDESVVSKLEKMFEERNDELLEERSSYRM